MDEDTGEYARFTLKGEMTVRISNGESVELTRVEAKFPGHFGDIGAPFAFAVEGKVDELRKLAAEGPRIAAILRHVSDEPGEKAGVLNLRAPEAKLSKLRAASVGTGPMDAQALLENVAWMSELFRFGDYEVESVGTVERWTETL